MSKEPEGKNEATPVKSDSGGDRSPARSKDRERDKADGQKHTGTKTDTIDGAEADEDTYN
jgi:hypothetical protein